MKRTTIRFDEDVLRRLKEKAAREDRSLQEVANELLRRALDGAETPSSPFKLRLRTWEARELPGVDVCDRKSLLDLMEDL